MSRPVAVKEPKVLPWNAFSAATNFFRPVARRATFRQPSTASVPLLQKKLYCRPPGVISASFSASFAAGSLNNTLPHMGMLCNSRSTASTIFGCLCPAANIPKPPRQSINSVPSVSVMVQPSARASTLESPINRNNRVEEGLIYFSYFCITSSGFIYSSTQRINQCFLTQRIPNFSRRRSGALLWKSPVYPCPDWSDCHGGKRKGYQ